MLSIPGTANLDLPLGCQTTMAGVLWACHALVRPMLPSDAPSRRLNVSLMLAEASETGQCLEQIAAAACGAGRMMSPDVLADDVATFEALRARSGFRLHVWMASVAGAPTERHWALLAALHARQTLSLAVMLHLWPSTAPSGLSVLVEALRSHAASVELSGPLWQLAASLISRGHATQGGADDMDMISRVHCDALAVVLRQQLPVATDGIPVLVQMVEASAWRSWSQTELTWALATLSAVCAASADATGVEAYSCQLLRHSPPSLGAEIVDHGLREVAPVVCRMALWWISVHPATHSLSLLLQCAVESALTNAAVPALILCFQLAALCATEAVTVFEGYTKWFTRMFVGSASVCGLGRPRLAVLVRALEALVPLQSGRHLGVQIRLLDTPDYRGRESPLCLFYDYVQLAKTRLRELPAFESVDYIEPEVLELVMELLRDFQSTNILSSKVYELHNFHPVFYRQSVIPALLQGNISANLIATRDRFIAELIRKNRMPIGVDLPPEGALMSALTVNQPLSARLESALDGLLAASLNIVDTSSTLTAASVRVVLTAPLNALLAAIAPFMPALQVVDDGRPSVAGALNTAILRVLDTFGRAFFTFHHGDTTLQIVAPRLFARELLAALVADPCVHQSFCQTMAHILHQHGNGTSVFLKLLFVLIMNLTLSAHQVLEPVQLDALACLVVQWVDFAGDEFGSLACLLCCNFRSNPSSPIFLQSTLRWNIAVWRYMGFNNASHSLWPVIYRQTETLVRRLMPAAHKNAILERLLAAARGLLSVASVSTVEAEAGRLTSLQAWLRFEGALPLAADVLTRAERIEYSHRELQCYCEGEAGAWDTIVSTLVAVARLAHTPAEILLSACAPLLTLSHVGRQDKSVFVCVLEQLELPTDQASILALALAVLPRKFVLGDGTDTQKLTHLKTVIHIAGHSCIGPSGALSKLLTQNLLNQLLYFVQNVSHKGEIPTAILAAQVLAKLPLLEISAISHELLGSTGNDDLYSPTKSSAGVDWIAFVRDVVVWLQKPDVIPLESALALRRSWLAGRVWFGVLWPHFEGSFDSEEKCGLLLSKVWASLAFFGTDGTTAGAVVAFSEAAAAALKYFNCNDPAAGLDLSSNGWPTVPSLLSAAGTLFDTVAAAAPLLTLLAVASTPLCNDTIPMGVCESILQVRGTSGYANPQPESNPQDAGIFCRWLFSVPRELLPLALAGNTVLHDVLASYLCLHESLKTPVLVLRRLRQFLFTSPFRKLYYALSQSLHQRIINAFGPDSQVSWALMDFICLTGSRQQVPDRELLGRVDELMAPQRSPARQRGKSTVMSSAAPFIRAQSQSQPLMSMSSSPAAKRAERDFQQAGDGFRQQSRDDVSDDFH